MKFNGFEFVQGMSLDVMDEINELREMLDNGADAMDIRRQYNHIDSLLVGIGYTLEYIEDEDDRQALKKTVENMMEHLKALRPRAKKAIEAAEAVQQAAA